MYIELDGHLQSLDNLMIFGDFSYYRSACAVNGKALSLNEMCNNIVVFAIILCSMADADPE